MTCPCDIAGLLSINYRGIISASLNGGTEISIASDGTVLLGQTLNTLSITAYAFLPGANKYLGVTCNASANASLRWIQRYDCSTDTSYMIPQSGGRASIVNGPITGVVLDCDPNIVSTSFSASVQNNPAAPYISAERRDGFNLIYQGHPIPINSGTPGGYFISLGPFTVEGFLQSFSLTVNPPAPATVNYNFTVPGTVN